MESSLLWRTESLYLPCCDWSDPVLYCGLYTRTGSLIQPFHCLAIVFLPYITLIQSTSMLPYLPCLSLLIQRQLEEEDSKVLINSFCLERFFKIRLGFLSVSVTSSDDLLCHKCHHTKLLSSFLSILWMDKII